MEIEVRLFANLQIGRFKKSKVNIASGATVSDLFAMMNISPADVGILVVNKAPKTFDYRLRENDALDIIPNIGGG